MKRVLLCFVACALLFVSCSTGNIMGTATSTPTPTSTVAPGFPPIGEWVDNVPYSLTNDAFALILDIQQANSTANVASLTSIVGECVYSYTDSNGNAVRQSQPYTYTASANAVINESNISLTSYVAHFDSAAYKGIGEWNMNFVGTINSEGTILLASSQLNGVQDYTFIPTTGAVAQIQSQFQQATCN